MNMCVGTFPTQRGFQLHQKLARCVEVMYPTHVKRMFHTPPLYMCRNIHCTVEGLCGQKRPSLGFVYIRRMF